MRVVVVALGRPQAMGERECIRTWQLVLAAAGHEVMVVRLLSDTGWRPPSLRHLCAVSTGAVVPETLRWSPRTAAAAIRPFAPDAVVALTARAHHPDIVAASPRYVLNLVDVMSTSYRDRGRTMTGLRSAGYRGLARAHARFERHLDPTRTVLVGYAEAEALGGTWVPLVRQAPERPERPARPVDVVFFGNLAYPPNIEAVTKLAELWPAIVRSRPATTVRIAGARPAPLVRELVARHGWELVADFEHLHDVLDGAGVAVVPLVHASGIQTKVLDAADHGVCQLLMPAAARGLHPSAPFPIAAPGRPFGEELLRLLDDSEARRRAARSGRAYVERWHRPQRWVDTVDTMLSR